MGTTLNGKVSLTGNGQVDHDKRVEAIMPVKATGQRK
jgi:hypothetical protein